MKKNIFIVIVFVFLCFLLFLFPNNTKAMFRETYLTINNTEMSSSVKKYVENQNVTLRILPTPNSLVDNDAKKYGYVALCSAVGSYNERHVNTVSSSIVSDIAIINSTVGCTIPTTNAYFNTSRVLYFTFEVPYSQYDCGVSSGSCYWKNGFNFTWYQNQSNEYSLISYGFSNEPFNFNSTTDPKVLQNDTIINQNQTIINQSNETNQRLHGIGDNQVIINNSINDANNTIKDSNVDSPASSINDAKNSIANNGVITQLVTLPVTLFQKILISVNGTCSSYNMGSLYGTDIILPCINISNYIGSNLWSVIDVLISGLFVWSISKKMIKVFNNFSTLKEGDVLGD